MIKRLNRLYSQLLLGLVLFSTASIHAQQTHLLLDPAGAGGFELGTTFADNEWTVVNGSQTNKWVLGSIPTWFAGNGGAYISNDNGVSNAYTHSISRVHFYRDIIFPVGAESVSINLDVFQAGESTWDNVLVYIADTSILPSDLGPVGSATTDTSWTGYVDGTTGYFLDRKAGATSATLSNINIDLTADQVNYVSGNTKRLIITWKNDISGGVQPPGSVDNIKVEAHVPVCYMVNGLSTSDVTNTSFTASWTPETNVTGYSYEVRLSGLPGSGANGLASSGTLAADVATFNATGLFGNATYNVYVRKNCSDLLGSSQWRQISVTTLCGISTYFVEGFETTPTGGTATNPIVPTCWSAIDSGAGYVYVTATSNFQSVRGLAISNNADVLGNYLAVSPKTDNLGNGSARLRFRAKTTSTTGVSPTLKVVTLANANNLDGVVQVESFSLTNDYNEYVVYLPAGTNDYFAFQHGLDAASKVIYIDDVNYELIPSCATPLPLNLVNATSNQVTVSWPVLAGTAASSNLNYEIRTDGTLPGSGAVGLAASGNVIASAGQITVSDLDHSEQYVFYIKAVCGSEEDFWTSVDFLTTCQVANEIYENFETTATNGTAANPVVPYCWAAIDSGAGYVYATTVSKYGGAKGVTLSNGTDTEGNYLLVSPETNNLGNGLARVRFRAKTTSTANPATTLKVVSLPNQNSVDGIVEIQTISLSTDYNEYVVYLPEGTNDYFAFKHGLNAASRLIYIDDVHYELIPACASPSPLSVTAASSSTVTVSWPILAGAAGSSNLNYEVRPVGSLPGSGADGLVASGTVIASAGQVTATGLDHSTPYVFYIKASCGSESDLWTRVSFSTTCQVATEIFESFDTTPINGSATLPVVPNCWGAIDSGAGSVYVTAVSNASSVRGVTLANGADVLGDYLLISPETNNLGNGGYRIRFNAKTTSSSVDPITTLKVVSLSNQNSIVGMQEIRSIELTTTHTEYIVDIPAGTNDYFGFKHGLDATSRTIYIDEVYYEPIPACPSPNYLVLSDITSSAVTLFWHTTSGLTTTGQYEYEVRTSGEPGSGAEGLATTGFITNFNTPFTITNLDHTTDFTLYLRANCGSNSVDTWREISFSTLCGVYTEINEAFDDTPVGTNLSPRVPNCWAFVDGDGTANGYVSVNAGTNISTPRRIIMYNGTGTESDFFLISPETNNLGAGTKQLRFFAYGNTAEVELTVGKMNGQSDSSIFTPLQTIQLGASYTEYVVQLPNQNETDDFFAFKLAASENARYVYIDDVFYEDIPACSDVLFNTVSVSSVTNNSAVLNWSSVATNFDIEYGPDGFTPGQGTIVENISNNYLLTGLQSSTAYDFYVRSNCGVNGIGEWSTPVGGFTTQTVVTSPWFEGFATATLPQGFTSTPAQSSISSTYNSIIAMSGNSIGYNLWSTNNLKTLTTVNVGPILHNDKLSFNYYFEDFGDDFGVLPEMGNFEVHVSTDFGSNYTLLTTINSQNILGWQDFETSLASYVGQIIKVKIVMNRNTEITSDIIFAFDNFYIGSCGLKNAPVVKNTTTNSATIEIEGASTDSYQIEYGIAGFAQGSGTVFAFTGNTATLSGLTESTKYDFYIRKVCNEIASEAFLGNYSFVTACPAFVGGFTENFDTTTVGSATNQTIPDCWTFIDSGIGSGYVTTSNSDSAPRNFYITNANSTLKTYMLVSPETQNLGNGTYQVTFRARGTVGAIVKVGTMTNKLDASTFVEVAEFPLTTTYQTFTVYLPQTEADYFAFSHFSETSSKPINIDNVVYEPILNVDCALPINIDIAKNFDSMSAQISWMSPANAPSNNFELEWGVTGFVQGAGTIVNVTNPSAILSNLILGESYTFYVRRICTDGSINWVGPFAIDMSYCETSGTAFDGDGMVEMNFANQIVDVELVANYLSLVGEPLVQFTAGENVDYTFLYNTGADEYYTHIWIDYNHDGVFSNSEKVVLSNNEPVTDGAGEGNTHILEGGFVVPNLGTYASGEYRMRVIGRELASVFDPCTPGVNSFTIDLMANISFPCIQPTGINFPEVGFDYVVIDWVGQGSSDFEIEYGITGFTPGSGAVVQNVSKPYTLQGLTSGVTYDFYIRKKCVNSFSDWSEVASTYVFCNSLEPVGESSQTLIQDELLSDLVIEGDNLKYYTDPDLLNEVPASTPVVATSTYFVTQTLTCESDSFLVVTVTVTPRIDEPVVSATQEFCGNTTLADLQVEGEEGATVNWYADLTSNETLAPETVLTQGTYYVNQTDGLTTSHRVAVNVVINETPVDLVSTEILVCGYSNYGSLDVGQLEGVTMKWYSSLTSITPIPNTQAVVSGTYYVTQSFGICESNKVEIVVSAFAELATPIAATQTFCGSATVSQLIAQGLAGAQLKWFSSATSNVELNQNSQLTSGTYYVEQRINGCVSARKAVAVRVVSLAAPVVESFEFCGSANVSDLIITSQSGVTHKWYISPSSTDVLSQDATLANGVYFVSRVQYGCESQRTPVQINILTLPSAPSGSAVQTFIEGSVISDLVLNQNNITWYASYLDSQNGVNPLVADMPLLNGQTYYAVIIGTNGCPSLPFAVTVDVYLSSDQFDKNELKYYPNPVDDVLTISYSETITQIEVFDLLGKRVKTIQTNENEVKVDLSNLPSGTYLVQLKTDTKQQFVKIIKR